MHREAQKLGEIVASVNSTALSPDEFLSDSVYCYSRERGELSVAF